MFTDFKEFILGENPSLILRKLHEENHLKNILPELSALDIKDEYSHKHKNNFYHSLQVLDNSIALEETPDVIGRTAALFHDVGKPATRKFVNGKATFRNHETVGARQVFPILKTLGFSKKEITLIQELIAHHMRSFGFRDDLWTDSAIRRLSSEISNEEQMKRLFILFKADVTTKYENKRLVIWEKADALYERIKSVQEKDTLAARRPAIDGHEVMEALNLKPGRELGVIMKFLNTEEGLKLSREEALTAIKKMI